MASNADFFLKKTLGDDFFESLTKFELWKPGTRTTVDHEEIKTALQIVPRTIMSHIIHHLSSMQIGETKETQIPISETGAMLRVTKHERDVYSGDIIQENKVVVDFKYRSIPGVALVIMSAFELYDSEKLLDPPQSEPAQAPIEDKIQKLIEERIALHDLVNKVLDKKMSERDAIHSRILERLTEELTEQRAAHDRLKTQISEVAKISKESAPMDEPYFRGMANGIEVVNATANNKEPEFIEAPKKKSSPVLKFLEDHKNKNKKEFSVHLSKGEQVECPDCGKNIFDGKVFSGCVCLGDDREKKVFIKKAEAGFTIRFSRGWDAENIEMLLEVLRRKRG